MWQIASRVSHKSSFKMKSPKSLTLAIIIIATCSLAKAQTANLNCEYYSINTPQVSIYSCILSGIEIEDNENLNFVFAGDHLPGYDDSQVQVVEITASRVPFIITQLFTNFPNLVGLFIHDGGLTRVQSNAFNNASNLFQFTVTGTPELQEVQANAFQGASMLS